MSRDARDLLVEYLREQAEWRSRKAQEYPEDHRNQRSAEGLLEAADYVENLPDDDERLVPLRAMHVDFGTDAFAPGEETQRLVSRFRFDDSDFPEDMTSFLHRLVNALVADLMDLEQLREDSD